MGIDFLLTHSWLTALIWAALYVVDYLSTVGAERVYREFFNRYHLYEGGVELNPNFERDIAARRFSEKFLFYLFFYGALLWVVGLIPIPYLYEFFAGMFLLTWLFVDSRHLRFWLQVRLLRQRPEDMRGRSEYSYWLTQRMFAGEALAFGLLFGLIALLAGRLFFLGGAVTCLSLVIRHRRLANRKLPTPEQASAEQP